MSRALISQVELIAPGDAASFEFHHGTWIQQDTDAVPMRPELLRRKVAPSTCVYGKTDTASKCPPLELLVCTVMLPGGHHFDGAYDELAKIVVIRIKGLATAPAESRAAR